MAHPLGDAADQWNPNGREHVRKFRRVPQHAPKDTGKWHALLVSSDEEENREAQALKTDLDWTEGD
jgi:DNA-binding transcriptional regulator PaaX